MSKVSNFWNNIKLANGKEWLLSVQHLFAMFGATILVPILTGMNISVGLVTAGLGTLLFHLITKGKVPVFLGSSFVFIGVLSTYTRVNGVPSADGVRIAQAGIIAAGLLYFVFALLAKLIGPDKIKKIFPPVVTGPVIILIGLGLAKVGINDIGMAPDATGAFKINWVSVLIALFTACVIIFFNVIQFKKNKVFKAFNIIPILMGILCGYLLCVIIDLCGVDVINYSPFVESHWINIPYYSKDSNGIPFFSLPKFSDWGAILSIALVAIVPFMEHIGDITTNGAVCGKDFFKDPGLHKTLLGDGAATALAGFLGGPCNTTYSENTSVLATTKNYNPKILRWTAIWAIILGFFGKFGAFLQTIPTPVRGGVEIILYGMISAIGLRTLAASKVDMLKTRNLIVAALILVTGVGIIVATTGNGITLKLGSFSMNISGVFVATIIGVVANVVLPKVKNEVRNMGSEEDLLEASIAYGDASKEDLQHALQIATDKVEIIKSKLAMAISENLYENANNLQEEKSEVSQDTVVEEEQAEVKEDLTVKGDSTADNTDSTEENLTEQTEEQKQTKKAPAKKTTSAKKSASAKPKTKKSATESTEEKK